MYWVNLLHLYQPADQRIQFLETVTKESYQPLLGHIKANFSNRDCMTLNINAALLEMWNEHSQFKPTLGLLKDLLSRGIIELTASGMYHPFFPLLPKSEIRRQIDINTQVSREVLGDLYQPRGFFPPELAYSKEMVEVLVECGFDWVVLDEIALNGQIGKASQAGPFQHQGTGLKIILAQRPPGYLGIMRGVIMDPFDFYQRTRHYLGGADCLVTATDAEIYGYHRPGQVEAFGEFIQMNEVECWSYSRFCRERDVITEVTPVESSWSTLPEEIREGLAYPFWRNPNSQIHTWLKELLDFTIQIVGQEEDPELKALLLKAERSDTFWWASQYKFWWSFAILEEGARLMRDIISVSVKADQSSKNRASRLYRGIVLLAVGWGNSQAKIDVVQADKQRMQSFEEKLAQLF